MTNIIQTVSDTGVIIENCFPEDGKILPEAILPQIRETCPIMPDDACNDLFCYTSCLSIIWIGSS